MADGGHLLFVSKSTGYELREAEGEPPQVGAQVELDEHGTYWVSRIGPSPWPGDSRPCAYLQTAP